MQNLMTSDQIREQVKGCYEKKGMINGYRCIKCKGITVVQLVEDGVTPFLIVCNDNRCNGEAKSMSYRNVPPSPPNLVYARPKDVDQLNQWCQEYIAKSAYWKQYGPPELQQQHSMLMGMIQHWQSGGLFLRPVHESQAPQVKEAEIIKPREIQLPDDNYAIVEIKYMGKLIKAVLHLESIKISEHINSEGVPRIDIAGTPYMRQIDMKDS